MILFLVVLLGIELLLIKKIVKFYMLSQIYLYLLFYIITIVLTSLYYYHFEDKISLYKFDYIKNELFIETIKFHLLALVAFAVGVILYYDLSRQNKRLLFNKAFSKVLFHKYILPKKTKYIILILFLVIFLLYSLTYGLGIFYRDEYLTSSARALQTITKLLSFVLSILLAFSYTKNKLFSVLLFTFLMILTLGTGSRIGFLYFVIYVFLVFQSKGNTLKNKSILILNLVFSFFLLSFIMTLRLNDQHGVFPYLGMLFAEKNELMQSLNFNIYYSFIFGIFVSAQTIVLNVPDWNNILISLNPATGAMAGWYNIAENMRIYPIVPFSSNGEVFTMGYSFTFLFYTILGAIVAYIDYKTRLLFSMGRRVLGFIIVILFLLYIVYSFEYNLRSSFRYIYYICILLFIFSIKIKTKKQ